MATPARNDSIAAMSKELVAQDPQIQKALRGLVMESIKMALYTMQHGSMQDKLQLMKHLTPHMLDALRSQQKSEADEAQRKAYEEMRAMLRGEVAP